MDVWFTVIRTDGYELIDFVKLILAIQELNEKRYVSIYSCKSKLNNKFRCKNHV